MRECPACLRCFGDEVSHCPSEGQATINSLPGEPTLEGRYLLERRLGQGGMGVVYKAHHVLLKSPHAIKVIMPDLVGNDPAVATRFRQEAMAAAAIRHPNIIAVTDYGFISGEIPFLVMEFVEGNSLQDVMSEEGKFSPETALAYIRAIGSGVGAAHQHGIVHRDLKPLNIMIQGNRTLRDGIRILDFGLAKIKSGELLGSFVGAKTTGIIGSPYYMAPEQWSDEEPDKRCDIYSLGIILHQMLTGDVPFKGTSIPAVMKKHLMTPPPQLASARGGISEALERVVHHALEKEPQARTATVEDLVAELERAVLGVDVVVGKPTPRRRAPARAKSVTSRAKEGVATRVTGPQKESRRAPARITAEQKKARLEEEALARRTADQEDARQKVEADKSGVVDEIAISLNQPAGEPANRYEANEEAGREGEEVETPTIAEPARQNVEGKESQSNEEISRRIEKEEGDLRAEEQESWRRAAKEARRRAEERALLESGGHSGNMPLTVRIPSLAPQPTIPPPLAGASPRKTQVPSVLARLQALASVHIVVGITLLVLIIAAASFYFFSSPGTGDTSLGAPPNSTQNIVARDMIQIQGGTFKMGRDKGTKDDSPAHFVTVPSFYMDKTEVTNAEYAAFIKATGHAAPANDEKDTSGKSYWKSWAGTDFPPGEEHWPVRNVSAKDAEAFAEWLSMRDAVRYRLPTEEEWEYAARNGSASTLFPWGDVWAEGRANINSQQGPRPVGSFPEGVTTTQLLDMIGNVWEWTSSKASYYDKKTIPKEQASAHVRRGGSFATTMELNFSPGTDRPWYRNEDYKSPTIGFRLVRNAP